MTALRKSPGNNYFRWTGERLDALKKLLQTGSKPPQCLEALGCHSLQSIYYGIRKLARAQP